VHLHLLIIHSVDNLEVELPLCLIPGQPDAFSFANWPNMYRHFSVLLTSIDWCSVVSVVPGSTIHCSRFPKTGSFSRYAFHVQERPRLPVPSYTIPSYPSLPHSAPPLCRSVTTQLPRCARHARDHCHDSTVTQENHNWSKLVKLVQTGLGVAVKTSPASPLHPQFRSCGARRKLCCLVSRLPADELPAGSRRPSLQHVA
jgi:hypothetical protein